MSDMKKYRNYYRGICLLGVFLMSVCASFVGAQTVSTIDVSGVEIGGLNYVTSQSFSGPGITWTANRDLWVSKVFYISGSFPYSYPSNLKMLAIPNSGIENEQVWLKSCWLQDIDSITFLIARTKAYAETNKVHVEIARCSSDYVPQDGDWLPCFIVNSIGNYIADYAYADAMSATGYNESQYDRVSYKFSTPCSGYLRLRINNTHTTPYSTACPYLLIPELTVVHNAPAPCSNCFSVTIR